jgi:hypothetical protein
MAGGVGLILHISCQVRKNTVPARDLPAISTLSGRNSEI